MNHSHEGLQGIFARAAYAADKIAAAPGKALRFLFGLSDRIESAIESAVWPRTTTAQSKTARAEAVETVPEVQTQADHDHAELMSGFDRFYEVLGSRDEWRKDPLKLACVHLMDRRFKEGEGGRTSWSEYTPALQAEIAKQQANKAAGIAPDTEFALALRYAEAKIAANNLPTTKERARAIMELDRADRATWAALRASAAAPAEVPEPA
jgi:hypothetical protein